MKIRVIKQGLVDWHSCEWLQPENLKQQSLSDFQKLKTSLIENGFASLFYVWDDPETGKRFILDGHHREKVLKSLEAEGVNIPNEFPAAWIDCKDMHEAKKFIMIFSSQYAKVRSDFLNDFLSDFLPDEIIDQISIPDIDLKDLFVQVEDVKPDSPEVDENKIDFEHECPQCGYQ